MKFSIWNQYFSHKHTSSLPKLEVLERLELFYATKKPKLLNKTESGLRVEKGSLLASIFCIGPETWCKNIVTIETKQIGSGTEVVFNINLKLPGLTIGKNFLLAEAQSACEEL